MKNTQNSSFFLYKACLTISFIYTFFSAIPLFAAPISLETFSQWVYNTHPFFQTQQLTLQQQQNNIDGSLGITDWNLNSSLSSQKTKPVSSSSFSPKKTETHTFSMEANKTIWKSGGSLSTYITSSQQNQDITPINLNGNLVSFGQNHLFQNQIGVSYTHPLLKNKNGILTQHPFQLEKETLTRLTVQLFNSTEHFVLSAIEKYLEWVHLHERNKLTQKQLDVATKSLKLLKRKYRDNLIEKLDVLRQEDAIRSIKHEQLSIQASITSTTAGLALLSNKDPELFSLPELSLNTPIPINKTLTFSATKAARLFESKTKFTKLQQQQLLETKKSNLDLGLTYGILSGDDSFSDSLNFDKHDQRVSLVYTKKIQNRSLTNELENINHELEKINAQKNEHEVNFNIEKKTLLSQIKSYTDIIELSKRQLQSNTDTLTEEKRLYYIGKSNLTFVLQAESNLHRAQSQHIQHLYNFQRLHIQYLALTDTLLSRYLPMSIL